MNQWLVFLFLLNIIPCFGAEYYISQHQAKVLPNKVQVFVMPEPGEVSSLILDKTTLKKGELIAAINPEQIAREEQELELTIAQDNLTQKTSLLQLTRQKEEIEFILGLDKEERKHIAKDVREFDKRALEQLDERISLTKRQMLLKEQKARAEFLKKRENYELRMPFDGFLQYHFVLPENNDEGIKIPASTPLATVADNSSYYVALSMLNPDIIKLNPDTLVLQLELGSKILKTTYSHKKIEKTGNTESLIYYFKVNKNDFSLAHDLMGANCVARLFYKTKEPLTYLHKMSIVSEEQSSPYTTWEEYVAQKYPDYNIVFVGETHLALQKK